MAKGPELNVPVVPLTSASWPPTILSPPTDAYDVVRERSEMVKYEVNKLLDKTKNLLDDMVAKLKGVDWPTIGTYTWPDLALNIGDIIARLEAYLPSAIDKDLLKMADVAMPSDPTLTAYTPNFPSAPTNPFVYIERDPFRTSLGDALRSKLLADIQAGGVGYTPAAEQAIYNRAKERLRIEHEANVNAIKTRAAGYWVPTGAVMGQLAEEDNRYQRELTLANNEVVVKSFELAQQYTQFVIESSSKWEQTCWQFYDAQNNRLLDAAKTNYQSVESFYKLLVDMEKAKGDLTAQSNATRVQLFAAQVDGAKARISKATEQAKLYSIISDQETKVFETMSKALYMQQESETKQFASKVEMEKSKADVFIKSYDAILQRWLQRFQIEFEAMKALAGVMAQLTASMAGALNVSAGISASSQVGMSQSSNYGQNISGSQSLSYDFKEDIK